LHTNSAIGGRASLRFEVTSDHTARNVVIEPTETSNGTAGLMHTILRCIEQRTHGFAFPPSASGQITLTLTFVPTNGGSISVEQANGGLLNGSVAGTSTTSQTTQAASPVVPGPASYSDRVTEAARSHVDEIRNCYSTALARSADLMLRTRVHFSIDPGGHVQDATSTNVVVAGDPDAAFSVGQCVEGIVRGIAFPAREGATSPLETTLPFSFAPTNATAAGANANASGAAAQPATGRIDAAQTSAAIRQNTDRIRGCYTNELRGHAGLAGRVVVRFTVDTAGRVSGTQSQVTPLNGDRDTFANVATCVEHVLQALTLPPPTGGPALVALPFDFAPNSP
jgi:outer membrane biosynthesis protein TonB